MPQTFLVTAATGKVGTELVHLLASAGHHVRAATRQVTSDKAKLLRAFAPERVTPLRFDVDDDAALDAALEGCDGLMVIFPFAGDIVQWHSKLAEAAKRAGIKIVVKLSVTGARAPDTDPPPGRLPLGHWRGEEAFRQLGVPTVSIRPTIFAQHALMNTGMYSAGADRLYLPTGDAKVAFVDCRDIAHCAAALLTADQEIRSTWAGRSFELTGPQGLTAAEIADILTWVRGGARVTHQDGMDAFSARCAELGKSDGIKGIYGEAAGGWFGEVENDAFVEIVGRSPASYAKFAFDHADFFRARRAG